jgi:hypothetical protein
VKLWKRVSRGLVGIETPPLDHRDANAGSDVQRALDALDDLTADFAALSDEDLDAVDAWANNAQLDIMRHRRRAGR